MSATAPQQTLPYGIGQPSPAWATFVVLTFAGLAFGVYAFSQQLLHGEIVTNMRTIGAGGVVWGLYITFYVVLIGVSFAGITVAALVRLFGLAELRPLARAAELLTIVALLAGGPMVLADLGRPGVGLLNLPQFARVASPFFGTFTMVIGGYLFASLVYFFLSGRADAAWCAQRKSPFQLLHRVWASGYKDTPAERKRHERVSFWLSLFILPLLVTAHSTLGFIFGIQSGRPGWFSALQAPGFVVMAGVSGIGVLIVIAAVLRTRLGVQEQLSINVFRWLGNFLWVLLAVYLYFMIAEELTVSYAAAQVERDFGHQLTHGAYAGYFWTVVATLVIPLVLLFVQFTSGRTSIALTVLSGVLVNVAAVLKRYLLVVGSQTHGMRLPYESGEYVPSWVEFGVVGGLICMAGLMYALFVKAFPILPVASHGAHDSHAEVTSVEAEPRRRTLLRGVLTIGTFLAGMALAGVGFAASMRVGTRPYLDPVIPYAPVVFINGLILIFLTGAVYEILPPVRRAAAAPPPPPRAEPAPLPQGGPS